ncbi:MAG: hypothetical protein JXR37_27400 [Kiritimatiellae bacterium]|nr:hypothetical protein [Kiritimatiellia bacterium]
MNRPFSRRRFLKHGGAGLAWGLCPSLACACRPEHRFEPRSAAERQLARWLRGFARTVHVGTVGPNRAGARRYAIALREPAEITSAFAKLCTYFDRCRVRAGNVLELSWRKERLLIELCPEPSRLRGLEPLRLV